MSELSSWINKVSLLLLPLLFGMNAIAQKVQFQSTGTRAVLESKLIQESSRGIEPVELHLSIPALDVDKETDGFSSLTIDGLSPQQIFGEPEISTAGSILAVPEGFEPELTIVNQEQKVLSDVVIRPAQRKFRCGGGNADSFSFNSTLYASKALYPESVAKIEEIGRLQDLRLVRVSLNPVQVDFTHRSTTITTDLVVRVNFRETGEPTVTHMSKSMISLAAAVTTNGASLLNSIRANSGAERMLIIVANDLKDSMQPLVQWKQTKGLEVDVATLSEAGGTKESVKTYIQKYYDQKKPTYLLFVGNSVTMPTYMESTGSGSAASDWQYSLLSGTDNIPDAFYGRLTADNADDVKVQIERWIQYEKNPEAGDWYNKAMTIASNEGSKPSDKEYALQIQDWLKKGTYKTFDSFFAADLNATSKNISAALNEGRTWIAYFGHGSGTSWGSTNDTFNVATVGGLKNSSKLPVIIDVACQNASWVKIPKCFGKAWVTQMSEGKAAGAVAFYGGSVNISWHEPAVMSVGVAKAHFEKSLYSLGSSVLAGQLYLIEKMGTGENTLDNMKWYNLLGDPSLVVRTDSPTDYRVKVTQGEESVGGLTLVISATETSSNAGVEGLLVSVSKANRPPIAVGKTDANGDAAVKLPEIVAMEPGTVLTVTGYNAVTHQIALDE